MGVNDSEFLEKKSFVMSFMEEGKVIGYRVMITHTLPPLPKGVGKEKFAVLKCLLDIMVGSRGLEPLTFCV
jgi:hypothetical protein